MPTVKPGSLRAEGISSIAVDKPTRSMLKQLAGDTPVAHYLKALVIRELGGKSSLPGQERSTSKNTIASVKGDTEPNYTLTKAMAELLSGFFEPWVVFQSKDKQIASGEAIEARLRLITEFIKKARPEAEQKGLFSENTAR